LERVREFNFPGIFGVFDTQESLLPVRFSSSVPPVESHSAQTVPVKIQDIQLKDGRSIIVDGRKIEIPFGTKEKISVKAIKKLAGSYPGSLILQERNGEAVRLRDDDVIELPKHGNVELKVVPSFRTE
jgi:hypothetical protein